MTASKLKLILAAALFAVPVPAFAQTPPPNWEMTIPGARQWAKDVCTERDSLRSDRACYRAFLRQQIVNRDEGRAALCRQEIIGRNEGLIATAPTNAEVDAGISEDNPTAACHRRNMP